MTAQEALKFALRDVLGPEARARGFKASVPTWRKSSLPGDWAVVNVQSSIYSTSGRLRCVVNLAVAPEPWLRWQRQQLGQGMPKAVNESLGLYRERLHPGGTPDGVDGWWEVSGPASAVAAATDMVLQLESAGWPVIDRMLAAGNILDQLRRGELGRKRRASDDVFFARAQALLIMDRGPSDELDRCLRHALENCTVHQKENALKFEEWVRGQSKAAT